MENSVEKKFCLKRAGYTLYSNKGDTTKRWFIYYYKEFDSGYRKRIKIYGYINKHSNPQKRFKAAELLMERMIGGTYLQENFEAVKLQALFDEYYTDRCRTLRKKTTITYLTKINSFINHCRKKKVDNVASINKTFALKYLAGIKRSPTTINSYRDTLRAFFEAFKNDKLIEVNPFEGIAKLPEQRRGKFPFNADQVTRLKTAISTQNPVLWMGCMLQYYCFIRPAEIRMLVLTTLFFIMPCCCT